MKKGGLTLLKMTKINEKSMKNEGRTKKAFQYQFLLIFGRFWFSRGIQKSPKIAKTPSKNHLNKVRKEYILEVIVFLLVMIAAYRGVKQKILRKKLIGNHCQ